MARRRSTATAPGTSPRRRSASRRLLGFFVALDDGVAEVDLAGVVRGRRQTLDAAGDVAGGDAAALLELARGVRRGVLTARLPLLEGAIELVVGDHGPRLYL